MNFRVVFFLFLWKMSGILIRSMLNLQMFWGIINLTRLMLPWIWYIFQYIEVFSFFHHLIIFNVQIFHLPGYIYSSVFIPFNAIKNWIILISDAHCCTLKCNRVLYIYFESFKLLNLFFCSNSFVGFLRFSVYKIISTNQ